MTAATCSKRAARSYCRGTLPLSTRTSGYTRFMKMTGFPLCTTDWAQVAPSEHPGETGVALWRTQNFGEIRVRMVEYSLGYSADHWCSKGHVVLCLEGELETTLSDGKVFTLSPGQSYQVADGESSHRSSTKTGARLFIVDSLE
jgi:quercetin dioxygenase-like cupin family protein